MAVISLLLNFIVDIVFNFQLPFCFSYELRVRYLWKNLEELFHTQKTTFYYLYEQVIIDYWFSLCANIHWMGKFDPFRWKMTTFSRSPRRSAQIWPWSLGAWSWGLQQISCVNFLSVLSLIFCFRRVLKDMQSSAIEKKSNLDYIEKEIGFAKFFPPNLIGEMKVNFGVEGKNVLSTLCSSLAISYYLPIPNSLPPSICHPEIISNQYETEVICKLEGGGNIWCPKVIERRGGAERMNESREIPYVTAAKH